MSFARVFVLVGLALAGCSSSDSSPSSSNIPSECPQPVGAYDAVFVKRSGTCADLGTRVVILDTPDDGCTTTYNRATPEGDGCKLEQKATCIKKGTDVDATLVIDIPGDLKVLTGTYTIDAQSEAATSGTTQSCTGTYDVTYTKR